MAQGNYKLYGCPQCGYNKKRTTHRFATYKVSMCDTIIKITCKTCGYTEVFRIIRGGI